MQAKMFEDKCKSLRDELKEAKDEIGRLNTQLADMVPRAELNAARKVHLVMCGCRHMCGYVDIESTLRLFWYASRIRAESLCVHSVFLQF